MFILMRSFSWYKIIRDLVQKVLGAVFRSYNLPSFSEDPSEVFDQKWISSKRYIYSLDSSYLIFFIASHYLKTWLDYIHVFFQLNSFQSKILRIVFVGFEFKSKNFKYDKPLSDIKFNYNLITKRSLQRLSETCVNCSDRWRRRKLYL